MPTVTWNEFTRINNIKEQISLVLLDGKRYLSFNNTKIEFLAEDDVILYIELYNRNIVDEYLLNSVTISKTQDGNFVAIY